MAVHCDFERKYELGPDPWGAGAAQGEYYDAFLHFIRQVRQKANIALDVGCGEGAFTARVAALAEKTYGFDVSSTAVQRAKERFPGIEFLVGDLRSVAGLGIKAGSLELIVMSQVLYYLTWTEASDALSKLGALLGSEGVICAAANCSGGDYFQPHEFRALFADLFDIVAEEKFQHHLFVAAKRRPAEIVITVDYEVFDYTDRKVTASMEMWEEQVIAPCRQLMAVCEEFGAKLTVMVEICEVWFLDRYMPAIAEQIRAQLVDAVRRGHDVQVHMHVRWLPELGAALDQAANTIHFNLDAPRLHELTDDDLRGVLQKAKQELEFLLQPIRADYEATVFRAGKYQIQPHSRVFAALAAAGYKADSSVWQGGFLSIYDRKPGYDFRSLWTQGTPYWPNQEDINTPARDARTVPQLLEMPIFARAGESWSFDSQTPQQLIDLFQQSQGVGPRIMIGHTKSLTPEVLTQLRSILYWLKESPQSVVFATMQEAVQHWWRRAQTSESQAAQQGYVTRLSNSPEELWQRLSDYHKRKVQLCAERIRDLVRRKGRIRIVDVGCGTGELFLLPLWHCIQDLETVEIFGVDIDSASIARAHDTVATYSLQRISFRVQAVETLSEIFDLVVSTEVIEHLEEPIDFLVALRAVVADDGVLMLSMPNGFGYAEIERRLLYGAFDLLRRLPNPLKKTFRSLYQKARVWRQVRDKQASLNGAKSRREVFATLNFANDIHIQYFTLKRLATLLDQSGFTVDEVHNVQLLGGLAGRILESPLNVGRMLQVLPKCFGAAWLMVCCPKGCLHQKLSSTQNT